MRETHVLQNPECPRAHRGKFPPNFASKAAPITRAETALSSKLRWTITGDLNDVRFKSLLAKSLNLPWSQFPHL